MQLVHSLVWQEIGGEEGEAEKTKEQAEGLITAVRTILRRPEKSAQRDPGKRDGLVITVERRGMSSEIPLGHLSCSQLHVWSTEDYTGKETAL